MKIDLHSHSTCSDGTLTPTELLAKAHQTGIEMFALTDHDTILGVNEAKLEAERLGMSLIKGVEISCHHTLSGGYGKYQTTSQSIHVVALNFTNDEKLTNKLKSLQESRANRGFAIVQKMAGILKESLGLTKIFEDELWQNVLKRAGDNAQAVGRAHIAQALHEFGVVKTVQEAFDKYLADNKPAYVAIETMSMEQTVLLIHECGGLAVLAHPTRYGLSATRVRRLVEDFTVFGGDAIELPNPSEPISQRAMIDRCVEKHGLMVSVGSDFHGHTMPWRRLGETAIPKSGQRGVWECFN